MEGNITQPNGGLLNNKNPNIYLLDIRNYTWVYSFEPPNNTSNNPSNNTSNNPSKNSSKNPSKNTSKNPSKNPSEKNRVIIAAVSGIFGTAILMSIGLFGYRWHKKRQSERQGEVLRVHGNKY